MNLVTCIMPTANRRPFLPAAIARFESQDYPDRELVILDDGEDPVRDLVPAHDPRIRYLRLGSRIPLGAKRNRCVEAARGSLIMHWDDDDWMSDWRIRYQVESMVAARVEICGLRRMLFHEPATGLGWLYDYPANRRLWLAGGSLLYTRELWRRKPFPEIGCGEDTRFIWEMKTFRGLALPDNRFYVATIHAGNTSPKHCQGAWWKPATEEVRALIQYCPLAEPPPQHHWPAMAPESLPAPERPGRKSCAVAAALKSDLDLPEFAAYRDGQRLPHMRHWELPWALFAARLTDRMAVLDCTINPAGFGERMSRLYPHIAYRHWPPIQDGVFAAVDPAIGETFDRVFCINTLEHLLADQRALLVAQLARALKPGGKLIVTGDYYFDSFWSRPEILKTGLVRADRGEVFDGFNKVGARDWIQLTALHGLSLQGELPPEAGEDDGAAYDLREEDTQLFRNPPPYPHAAIGAVFSKEGPELAIPRNRVLLSLLTWNTVEASIDSLNAYLREAAMLERLGYRPMLCVCDNGSTDGSAQALRDRDAHISVPHRFLLNETNRGNSIGRNQIVSYAREVDADYILFMDGDIEIVPFSSVAMLRYLETQGPDAGCIGALSSSQSPVRERTTKFWYCIDPGNVKSSDVISWTQYGMYRREVFDNRIQFDESGPFGGPGWGYEDNDLAFQMRAKGFANLSFSGMTYLHRNMRSSVPNLRRSGIDPNSTCVARRQFLLEKWASHPEIAKGPLEEIRRHTLTI